MTASKKKWELERDEKRKAADELRDEAAGLLSQVYHAYSELGLVRESERALIALNTLQPND